ncbi:Stomatin-like protein 2, mitochondrial [Seminavis robusta]|uniref:Stomatin-like protein 2, mitochondrial n=1 Tax=Seminavis robusta TaxID=568900 RepID=A0A9N8H246_9STRA|nr:Stomatin-like protein 2, mitochondrial [Seminavis robusta]|eukprot:Sro12_g009510.1 Stomatin-like protein 2, mitochondrial (335) ;mRNA; r:138642-139745
MRLLVPYLLCFVAIALFAQHGEVEAMFPLSVKQLVGIGGCVACAYGAACVKVVTSGDECLIERLGKYHRKLDPGWHWIARPFEAESFHVTTREQVMDVPPQQCYTVDNAPLHADAVVYMRIIDSVKARYAVREVREAIMNLCLTQLREEVGKLTLDETFSSRDRINKALLYNLNGVCQEWGVQITRIEIQDLQPSRDILAAMESQISAARKKRAAILLSEGERTTLANEADGRASALVADAEAKSKSMVLLAKAQAEKMKLESEGLQVAIAQISASIQGSADNQAVQGAIQLLVFMRYLDTQAKFASTNSTKVLMFPTKDSLPLTYPGLESLLK